MFANVTVVEAVGAVLAIVAGLVAFLKGVEYLWTRGNGKVTKWMQKMLEPTNSKIDHLEQVVKDVDMKATHADLSSCKNFLVRFLADVEQGQPVDEVERTRFWETYDHYVRDLNQNSYIKEKVANLKAQGKL